MNEYVNVIRNNYANFTGRARRREYWMFALINGVIGFLLQLPFQLQNAANLNAVSSEATVEGLPGPSGLGLVSLVLAALYGLAVLVPSLAVGVRRLHDTGKSGWLLLLGLIPVIGGLILLVFYVADSQPGANKWGPNPKGVGNDALAPANNW